MQIESAYSREVLIPDLYSELLCRKEILSYKKEVSVKRQKMGVDMVLEKETGNSWSEVLLVDEKTPFNYLSMSLNTFAFELSFLLYNGKEMCGWFLNDKLVTTHYLCSYPRYRDHLPKRYKVSSLDIDLFCDIDCLLIPKKSLIAFLDSIGLTHDKLQMENNFLRCCFDSRNKVSLKNGLYLRKSTGLSEQPINLIIPKPILIDLACSRYLVRGRDGFDMVK